jgi:hypothetical protein
MICEVDEISNNELKEKRMATMINKIEEDVYKHLNEFKEDTHPRDAGVVQQMKINKRNKPH